MKKVEKTIVKEITNSCNGTQNTGGCQVVYVMPYCSVKKAA